MSINAIKRRTKDFLRRVFAKAFAIGQVIGVDILPRHFYSEIPDLPKLRKTQDWRQPRSMFGVGGADIGDQLAFVRECCAPELIERVRVHEIYGDACQGNGLGYGPIEADFLYCFVTTKVPRQVVQVGAGVATAVLLRAAQDAGRPMSITCIDPYPTRFLREAAQQGTICLREEEAQRTPLEVFTSLEKGDLLFVDSTHAVRPGSEVNRIVLEVLPRLQAGTFAHFHDIYFPYDYGRSLLSGAIFFYNESTLLHAFLVNNSRFAIRASLSMLHYACPDDLRELLPNYRPCPNDDGLKGSHRSDLHFPSSTYLEVLA